MLTEEVYEDSIIFHLWILLAIESLLSPDYGSMHGLPIAALEVAIAPVSRH